MAGIEAERESRGLQSAGGNCTKFWMKQSMETTQRSNWVVDLTRPLGGICVELKSDERVNAMSDVRVCVCVCVFVHVLWEAGLWSKKVPRGANMSSLFSAVW
jgi:hypothetical protein